MISTFKLGCVWILHILLKIENLLLKTIKKIIFWLLFTPQNTVHCLNALFIPLTVQEALVKKKKKGKMLNMDAGSAIQTGT